MPAGQCAFDFEPYRFAMDGTTAPMDELHIHKLREAIRLGRRDQVAVEIGSWRGASTSAFVDAVNAGEIAHFHVIETNPKDCLRRVISMCRFPERITLHQRPSWDLQLSIKKADFVFVDGDHEWAALADTLQSLSWGARIICIHDSHAWPKDRKCWGSHTAVNILRGAVGRVEWEDVEQRAGMMTERGFFISAVNGIDLSGL